MRASRSLASHFRDPLYRDAWFLMGNAALGAATGFLFWLVAARVAPPAEVGRGAAIVSAFTLAALLGKFGFDAILIRHAPELDPARRRRLLTRTLAIAILATGAIASASLALARVAPTLPDVSLAESALFVAFAACTAAGWVLDAWFVAERRAGRSFARNAVFNAGRLALVALPVLGLASPGLAVAWGAAAALSLVVAVALPRRVPTHAPLPPVLATGAANYAVGVGEFFPGLFFPVLVAATLGPEANAAFYVAWTLAAVPFLASKAIAQSTFAELSGGDRATALARGARLHALVLAPAILGGLVAGPWILGVFGGSYRAAWPLLAVLLLALVPAAANNLAIAALKASDRRRALVGLSSAQLLLTVVVGTALLPFLGALAPGLAFAGANLALLPWSLPILAERRWNDARGLGRPAHEG